MKGLNMQQMYLASPWKEAIWHILTKDREEIFMGITDDIRDWAFEFGDKIILYKVVGSPMSLQHYYFELQEVS